VALPDAVKRRIQGVASRDLRHALISAARRPASLGASRRRQHSASESESDFSYAFPFPTQYKNQDSKDERILGAGTTFPEAEKVFVQWVGLGPAPALLKFNNFIFNSVESSVSLAKTIGRFFAVMRFPRRHFFGIGY
jgi:hypothetical protein